MSVKISELPSLMIGNLVATANTAVPIVSDVDGTSVTYQTTLANVKTYVETGNLSVSGALSVVGGSTFNNVLINGILTTINPQVSAGSQSLNTTDSILDIHYQQNSGVGNVNVTTSSTEVKGDGSGNLRAVLNPGYTLYVNGNVAGIIANVTSSTTANLVSNSLISANTKNFTYTIPVDDGKDIGVRLNYYKTDYDQGALVWKNTNRQLIWYGAGAGTATTGIISANATYGTMQVGSLWVANTTATTGTRTGALQVNGGAYIGGDIYSDGTITNAGQCYTIGNTVVGGYIQGNTSVSVGSNLAVASVATINVLSVNNSATIGTTLAITGTTTTANIIPSSNTISNIGSTTRYYNTIFASTFQGTAVQAKYADLAERYLADAEYEPGTVVIFGGSEEITVTTKIADNKVAGVISTDPAYLMNSQSSGLPVALRGKVPVKVIGVVNKGDLLVTSATAGYAMSLGNNEPAPYTVVAKSLESSNIVGPKTVIAVVL